MCFYYCFYIILYKHLDWTLYTHTLRINKKIEKLEVKNPYINHDNNYDNNHSKLWGDTDRFSTKKIETNIKIVYKEKNKIYY